MKIKRLAPASLLLAPCVLGLAGWGIWRWRADENTPRPFHFPFAELARLDNDLQTRFLDPNTTDFGINRVSNNQHNLYVPKTASERETIRQLKGRHTEVAFYLMSRTLWVRGWDGSGFKPIQGPVYLTGAPIQRPLPRAINFDAGDGPRRTPPSDGVDSIFPQPPDLVTNSPAGTAVPSPTPPPGAPPVNQLQRIGNRVFDLAEDNSDTARLGLVAKANQAGWTIVAVPVRASSPACLTCHSQLFESLASDSTTKNHNRALGVGDALGVAFYIYRQADAIPEIEREHAAQNHN